MNILMLSATFPYPPTRGGTAVRTFNLLKHLKQKGHSIALATQRTTDVTETDISHLKEWVDDLGVFPRPSNPPSDLFNKVKRLANFALEGTPPSVSSTHSASMQRWLDHQIVSGQFDAITCEHCVNEAYVPSNIGQHIPVSIVNIHSSVYGTCAHQLEGKTAEKVWRDRLNLPLLKRYEQRYTQKFSHLVVTTVDDRQQIAALSGKETISVIPNGVDLEVFTPRPKDPGGHSLIFIGAMDNLPNIDSVTFLAKEIFPLVRARYPQATLSLVGARPGADVKSLAATDGITVTGKVPEMTSYLHHSTVCVVPMRTGYGIKNKTLEAMAAGIPVVASDRGLEGLPVNDTIAMRANTPEDYADAIGQLFESAELRQQLSSNGRSLIEREFTWKIAGDRYESLLSNLRN
ncbi:MAG: glycosyltransferase family 4 protein [Cyanobacteria bacterium P01_D01_bin.105]